MTRYSHLRACLCFSLVTVATGGCTTADAPPTKDAATADIAGDAATQPSDTPTELDQDSGTDAAIDSAPPQVDITVEASSPGGGDGCTPDCKGKLCGPNGCGSVCGFCKSGEFCEPGGSKCSEYCKPKCDGKACGSDGCGGQCGTCDANFHCGTSDGTCYKDSCVGSCDGKNCGDNGCGKPCGECAGSDWCDGGTCKASACKGLDLQKGQCDGDFLLTCQGSGATAQKITKDCAAPPSGTGQTCGWDAIANAYGCIKKVCDNTCKTDGGAAIVCGNNACGNPCGTCPSGWKCNVTACAPAAGGTCSDANFQAKCDGNSWIYCNTGTIKTVDCVIEAGASKCGWNAAVSKFECIY